MPPIPPVGPLRVVGRDNPMYVLPFDKHGATTAPQTLEHARATLRSGGFTDVYLFSHGWNNDWATATGRYDDFAEGLVAQGADDPGRRALLLGIFWPSTLLVAPWERAPAMAGETADPERDELAGDLEPAAAARLRELSAGGELDDERAAELAGLLSPVADPAALTAAARAIAEADAAPGGGDWGTVTGTTAGPAAAGVLAKLDPRNLIRAASVWQMKDRAGVIGTTAVAPLLHDALAGTTARVHCVGHSFGGKVMLSALAAREPARRAHSLLLLQPAVNHLCFAPQGGYRPVLGRTERPVFTTYSARDVALTRFFHLAVRREADRYEPRIAAWPEPPSPYAALGGYGPREADDLTQQVVLRPAGSAYALDPERPLAAVDATDGISGHGAISNARTWWALRELSR
ncbi:MAG: hypothetical protein ABW060_04925 [Solirubrobacteraceae bacterium]